MELTAAMELNSRFGTVCDGLAKRLDAYRERTKVPGGQPSFPFGYAAVLAGKAFRVMADRDLVPTIRQADGTPLDPRRALELVEELFARNTRHPELVQAGVGRRIADARGRGLDRIADVGAEPSWRLAALESIAEALRASERAADAVARGGRLVRTSDGSDALAAASVQPVPKGRGLSRAGTPVSVLEQVERGELDGKLADRSRAIGPEVVFAQALRLVRDDKRDGTSLFAECDELSPLRNRPAPLDEVMAQHANLGIQAAERMRTGDPVEKERAALETRERLAALSSLFSRWTGGIDRNDDGSPERAAERHRLIEASIDVRDAASAQLERFDAFLEGGRASSVMGNARAARPFGGRGDEGR